MDWLVEGCIDKLMTMPRVHVCVWRNETDDEDFQTVRASMASLLASHNDDGQLVKLVTVSLCNVSAV